MLIVGFMWKTGFAGGILGKNEVWMIFFTQVIPPAIFSATTNFALRRRPEITSSFRVCRIDTGQGNGHPAVFSRPVAVPIPTRRASEGTGYAFGAGLGQRPSLARRASVGLGHTWPGRETTK